MGPDRPTRLSASVPQLHSRRDLLRTCGIGFGSLGLHSLLQETSQAAMESKSIASTKARKPHFTARAKRIIFLFMKGGPSHIDTFDPKSRLTRDDGKPLPFPKPRLIFHATAEENNTLLKSPFRFSRYGESGIEISDLFPHISQCADDLCVVNSVHGSNPAHGGATLKLHTGSDTFVRPSLGSWISYGLGTENQNLPAFISISPTLFHGGVNNYSAAFLPAVFQGTSLGHAGMSARDLRVRFINNTVVPTAIQRAQLHLLKQMHLQHKQHAESDSQLDARIQAFELAFRMQTEIPGLQDLTRETKETQNLYGLDDSDTFEFGTQCLLARKFAERGVRFIQVTHQKGSGHWDQHADLVKRHRENAKQVDRPIAGLLKDLKRQGLLKDTLVLWGGEFGRTPTAEGKDPKKIGRDHNPEGFTMWMAGGGIKGGMRYGATDEYGYYAVKNKVHIHDLHATLLHCLGLDHKQLTFRHAGRDFRLTDVYGNVVQGILS